MVSCKRLPVAAAAAATTSWLPSFQRSLATQIHLPSRSEEKPAYDEEEEEIDKLVEEESITNRLYWRKKIHSLCVVHGDVDEALRLLDRLRLRGYRPDSLNLASVVHALCTADRSEEAHRRLLLSAATGWLPDDRTANVLIARLLDARTPLLTLQVVLCLTDAKPAFVPSLTNYNRLIDQLSSQSQPFEAYRVLVDMRRRGRLPDAVSYTALINGFAGIGELERARQLFDEMTVAGILPNSLTYSVLIKAVLRKRRVEEGRDLMVKLWKKMEGEGESSVNGAAFANLIDSFCREGFYHEVFRIAEEMPQGKSVSELFAYGQMIDSLCRRGNYHGASRIVYIMRKRGFTPSIASYNCIVHGLSKERGSMRAYQLFEEGIKFGYSPTESTYKVLVEGLCREKDTYKARNVLEFMLKREAVNKTRIYNMFLNALHFTDNPNEQLNVLVSMLQKQCQPDLVTLNTVVHGFCKIGKVDEAKKIIDDMLSGKFCEPDVVTFTTFIRGLMDNGKPEEALDVLHKTMPGCQCAPNVVTYNVVLHGLIKLGKVDEAMEIFNEMVSKGGIADSTTYTIVIEGLCKAGRLEEVKRFWDDIIWQSQMHDDYVYGAILRGLCSLGKFDQACDFLYELVDCGLAPGVVNYNIVIDCACKMGLKKEAYQIVAELRKNGLKPDAVTWRILDKLHGNKIEEGILSNQNSELNKIAETEIQVGLHDDATTSIQEEKECNINIENDGYQLDGLVDACFFNKSFKDSISQDHEITKEIEFSGENEPLSKIARKIFGLL
ncbi:hypothetical protein Cni_G12517 [Canna indica]|uniref:Pentatricopeptide repeat-containing protein n=1 Tax=Canna indica TaxID=4628 RepID=A0AAQ3KC02_9LILI|nr:hypothetical protein Cni_G12517 [Canna indica]